MGTPQGGFLLASEAQEIVGGKLSQTSKMPGASFGIPAKECITGSKLRKVKGSVCEKCYALKGFYQYPNVGVSQYKRFDSLRHPRWVDAMVALITRGGSEHFRWHDAGDLQGVEHLENIAEVARRMPHVRFFLPTREKAFVRQHQREGYTLPKNLVLRVSSTMVGDGPMEGFKHTSGVVKVNANCPAPKQGNKCGDCRACWNPKVKHITYLLH
jgi:hypothetical protein